MPTKRDRITAEQEPKLAGRRSISDSIRKAVRRYLDDEASEVILANLGALQRTSKLKTTPEEKVRMIKEDRSSHLDPAKGPKRL